MCRGLSFIFRDYTTGLLVIFLVLKNEFVGFYHTVLFTGILFDKIRVIF